MTDLPKFPCKCYISAFLPLLPFGNIIPVPTLAVLVVLDLSVSRRADRTNWLALPCSGLCLCPPHFPPKAVLVWRINSTPLTIPPYSGVAHAITISPMQPFSRPSILQCCSCWVFFYGKRLSIPLPILQDSACVSPPPKDLHQPHCALLSMNLYHCSVPFILTLHHLLLCILNWQESRKKKKIQVIHFLG